MQQSTKGDRWCNKDSLSGIPQNTVRKRKMEMNHNVLYPPRGMNNKGAQEAMGSYNNMSNMNGKMSHVQDNAPSARVLLHEIELPPKCVFCESKDHDANQCKEVATWKDRRSFVFNYKLCATCLGPFDTCGDTTCPQEGTSCHLCRFRGKPEPSHHYSLCKPNNAKKRFNHGAWQGQRSKHRDQRRGRRQRDQVYPPGYGRQGL